MTLPNTSAIDEYQNPAEQAMTVEDYALAKQLAEQAQVDAQLISTTAAKSQKASSALLEDNRVLRQELNRKSQ